MFILDTNTLIYFFKGLGNVDKHLLNTSPQNIGIPSIVVYELEYGITRSSSPQKRIEQLQHLCSLVTILPFSQAEAQSAALIRSALEKVGRPIGPHDILIAATAMVAGGTLVTNNTKEFERIDKLQLVNWYQG